MHMSLIPSLARNSEDYLRVHLTRARRFVDRLTGDRARNNRVGDTGNARSRIKDTPVRQGLRQTDWGPG